MPDDGWVCLKEDEGEGEARVRVESPGFELLLVSNHHLILYPQGHGPPSFLDGGGEEEVEGREGRGR